jgi:hypothetical protein
MEMRNSVEQDSFWMAGGSDFDQPRLIALRA